MLRIEVDDVSLAEKLIAIGYLARCDEDDVEALAQAAAQALEDLQPTPP